MAAGTDRYEALLAVLEQQAEQSHEGRSGRGRGSRRGRELLLVLLVIVSGWLWVAPPGWLQREAEPPPIEEEESALRLAMYLQAQRIRAFEQANGRLPETLEEAGPPLPGVAYSRTGERYELTGTTARLRIVYPSEQPLRELVGDGAAIVDGPARP